MKRIFAASTTLLLSVAVLACGEGEPDAAADLDPAQEQENGTEVADESAAALSTPDWMNVDHDGESVTMDIVAGETTENNSWNFNGYHSGNATVVVPEGYEITINLENADQINPHSIGVDSRTGDFPANFEEVDPVFDDAATAGAETMEESTQPGESESITFTADQAGDYSLVCYVPAHAVTGMWIHFEVSADGEAGLRES